MRNSEYDTVPEMSDLDFDLGTMDTFEDLDINMASMDMMNDFNEDPFGDINIEQSFNLIELNKVFNGNNTDGFNSSDNEMNDEAMLEEYFDNAKETLKDKDIMWSSAHAHSRIEPRRNHHPCRNNPQLEQNQNKQLSLTPPSSYMNHIFSSDCHSPISSEDDTCPHEEDTRLHVSNPHVSDHCYTSMTSTSLLTPPESSEDEDNLPDERKLSSCDPSSSNNSSHRNFSKSRSQLANEKLNNDVKKLLRTTHKNLTNADKPKFKFSIRVKKIKNVPFPRRRKDKKKQKFASKVTVSSYQALKENKQSLRFCPTSRQTIKLTPTPGIVTEKIMKNEKLSNREARDVHNEMERQRRSDLNREYAKLKDFVPSIAASDRTSKQIILDKAIEHCTMLRSKEEAVRLQKRNLQQRNEELRKKIQLLESQMVANQVENAEWEIQGW